MKSVSKRTTIYIDPQLHRALRIKAAETDDSMSDLIRQAIRISLAEDAIDLAAYEDRKHEPRFSFEEVTKKLRKNGKI
jgi:predicted transcriptional regulator